MSPMVLKLLMFKGCGIMGVSKIKFFNFFGTERVNDDEIRPVNRMQHEKQFFLKNYSQNMVEKFVPGTYIKNQN